MDIKVIIANPGIYPFQHGGVAKYFFYLGKAMSQLGAQVEFVSSLPSLSQRDIHPRNGALNYKFLPPVFYSGFYNSIPEYFLFNVTLATHLPKRTFDVLHAYWSVTYHYLHNNRRKPVILQPFEDVYMPFNTRVPRPVEITYYAFKKHMSDYCIGQADAIAAENAEQERVLVELGARRSQLFSLPVGVDIQTLDDAQNRSDMSRTDLTLAQDDFVILSVSSLEPLKGIDDLIESYRLVRKRIPNAKLVIVGKGSLQSMVDSAKASAIGEGIIQIKNLPESSLYKLYSISDIFLSPTLAHSGLMSVLEAMASRLPIVSSGQSFWIREGLNGYVVGKKAPQALADAIVKVWATGARFEMGKSSRLIAEQYDFRMLAKDVLEKYEEVLSRVNTPS